MHENQVGWLPARAVLNSSGLYLALRQIGADQLQDAFMHETVARINAPEEFVHIAGNDIGKAAPETAPAGMIFHVARCGSTLLSQSLKQHGDLVVYAEPLPVNEILLSPDKWSRTELVAALRSLGDALARHAQKPYVLKFSSWNTLFCDILTEAFPQSPWVFCLRDPVEVGVSLLQQSPGWLRDNTEPANRIRSFYDPEGTSKSPEETIARLYGAFCKAASRLDPRQGKLVLYEALPRATWEVVAPHFSLSVDVNQRNRMADAARTYAKAPLGNAPEFVQDVAMKQAAASDGLRQAIDSFAKPELEHLRRRHAH